MAALEEEQAETDRHASQLETQLRAVMKSGTFVVVIVRYPLLSISGFVPYLL